METAFRAGLGKMDVTSSPAGDDDKDAEWDDDSYVDNGAYDYAEEKKDEDDDNSTSTTTLPEAQELLSGLFISDYSVAKSEPALRKHQITHILCVAPLEEVFATLEDQFGTPSSALAYSLSKMHPYHVQRTIIAVYKTIPWRDTDLEDILPDFEVCFKFIDKAREGNGTCLIHCSDGVSRSGAISVAYIMRNKRLPLKVRLLFPLLFTAFSSLPLALPILCHSLLSLSRPLPILSISHSPPLGQPFVFSFPFSFSFLFSFSFFVHISILHLDTGSIRLCYIKKIMRSTKRRIYGTISHV